MAKAISLVIEPDGTSRHLVDAESEKFGSQIGPKTETRRASHVESWGDLSAKAQAWLRANGWCLDGCCHGVDPNDFWADLLPVSGPVLGPFKSYEQATAAEIAWLQERNLPYGAAPSS